METELPLIVIVGPTASGKTSLALDVAERYHGEIICADSRTVYKGMDIGTAKPTRDEQSRIPHWGLDLVEPDERFTAADFKQHATQAIADIRRRGKVPIMVGGTGLYVDSVVYDYSFLGEHDGHAKVRFEAMSLSELHDYCAENNIPLPENGNNKRHVVNTIVRNNVSGIGKSSKSTTTHIVGIATNRDELRTRIMHRTEQFFDSNVAGEATLLGEKYGWEVEAMTGNIYPLLKLYLDGRLSIEEVKDRFITLDCRLAKRQMTWLRRNPDIMWAKRTSADSYISGLLVSE